MWEVVEGVWQDFKCSTSDNECQAYLCDMEVLVIRHETQEECHGSSSDKAWNSRRMPDKAWWDI
jgi:hypothetical protein